MTSYSSVRRSLWFFISSGSPTMQRLYGPPKLSPTSTPNIAAVPPQATEPVLRSVSVRYFSYELVMLSQSCWAALKIHEEKRLS